MRKITMRYFSFAIGIYIIVQMYTSGILTLPRVIPTRRIVYRPSPTDDLKEDKEYQSLANAMRYHHVTSESGQSAVRILRGAFRPWEGFLTIGLSSVPRKGASYLIDTLESLFSRLTEPQKNEVVVVLFLGSQDEGWINKTLSDLDGRFEREIQSSLLQVIQPLPHIYPNFSSVTKRNFGDNLERVHWRTKQNIDFAHLFYHCRNISQYYIQIEDDVLVASDFINDIKNFVKQQEKRKTKWFTIEFSVLGFIGKMFHSKDLAIIKEYLLIFKEEQPCDLLINLLKRVMVQPKDIRSRVSLFQHVGKISSLNNKTQKLTDKFYKDKRKVNRTVSADRLSYLIRKKQKYVKSFSKPNPSAKITTTLDVYKDYKPQNAYLKDSTFFWGKEPRSGDYIEIKLATLTNITAVSIKTGHPRLRSDKLENGEVRLAHDLTENGDCNVDADYRSEFSGSFYVTFEAPRPIICAVIVVKEDQKSWLIVNEIELRTSPVVTSNSDENR